MLIPRSEEQVTNALSNDERIALWASGIVDCAEDPDNKEDPRRIFIKYESGDVRGFSLEASKMLKLQDRTRVIVPLF